MTVNTDGSVTLKPDLVLLSTDFQGSPTKYVDFTVVNPSCPSKAASTWNNFMVPEHCGPVVKSVRTRAARRAQRAVSVVGDGRTDPKQDFGPRTSCSRDLSCVENAAREKRNKYEILARMTKLSSSPPSWSATVTSARLFTIC